MKRQHQIHWIVLLMSLATFANAAFPDSERGKALGIHGAIVSAGLLTGPALGGFLLDALGCPVGADIRKQLRHT